MKPEKNIVAFLPWLHLKRSEGVAIGPVTFVPFAVCCSEITGISSRDYRDLKNILSTYKELEGCSVRQATLLFLNGDWKLIKDHDEGDIIKVANIAAFAAISKNRYFTNAIDSYANTSLFKPVFQGYRTGAPHLALRVRRRDGYSVLGGYDHGEVNITRPIECQRVMDGLEVDESLAKAVWDVKDEPVGKKIITSLSFFCLANTDSEQMEVDAEVILMASAFDQLFECGCANAYCLAEKLGEMFNDYDSVLVERVKCRKIWMATREGGKEEDQKKWKVIQKWIEEFYHLRNEKVHGDKRRKPDEWAWSMDEHLVMASFVFPLMVKLLLENEGCYSMTDRDKKLCDAVDVLLSAKPGRWAHRRTDVNDVSIWSKVCNRMSNRAKQEIIDEVNAELEQS